MKILIAPDSFKESLGAAEVATALARGIATVLSDAEFDLLPMADGGEGTVEAIVRARGGQYHWVSVTGPMGERINARYGILDDGRTAVVEMASASGLGLVPPATRDPTKTTSYGTGEIVRHIIEQRVETIILGIGGSATVDGGAGLCQALGVQFTDRTGHTLCHPISGGQLTTITTLDRSAVPQQLGRTRLRIACDVDNPLLGARGAAAVFGPQKGASASEIATLETGLSSFYDLAERALGIRVRDRPGAGAGGGAGAALCAFFGAELESGVAIMADALRLADRIRQADVVITGEGNLDAQTLFGKAPHGIASLARQYSVPVIAVGGSITAAAEPALSRLFDAMEACVTAPGPLATALCESQHNLERAGARIGHWLALCKRL